MNIVEQIRKENDLFRVAGATRPGEPDRVEILNRCLDSCELWVTAVGDYGHKYSRKLYKQRKLELTQHIKEKTDLGERPVGFIDSIIWSWVINRLVSWVVTKILEHLFKNDSQ